MTEKCGMLVFPLMSVNDGSMQTLNVCIYVYSIIRFWEVFVFRTLVYASELTTFVSAGFLHIVDFWLNVTSYIKFILSLSFPVFQVMGNATAVSVNAMLVILETTVIALQRRLPVCQTTGRSVVGEAVVCVGGASALSQGRLGTRAKNVPPVQMPVEQRGMWLRMLKLT